MGGSTGTGFGMIFDEQARGLQTILGSDDKRLVGMYYIVLREQQMGLFGIDRIIIGNSPIDVKRNISTSGIPYIMKSKIHQIEEP